MKGERKSETQRAMEEEEVTCREGGKVRKNRRREGGSEGGEEWTVGGRDGGREGGEEWRVDGRDGGRDGWRRDGCT